MDERDERKLAGSSGDDISAGTSVSGVGGEAMDTGDDEGGLSPAYNAGPDVGWRKDASEIGDQFVAGNDGTGQSERPAD